MKSKTITVKYKEYQSLDLCPKDDILLVKSALSVMEDAYAPYSRFKVGASVLLEDGTIVQGNNQENASFPLGSCAEKVAVHYAMAMHPNAKIRTIAIVASNTDGVLEYPITPCGSCRQVLLEVEKKQEKPIRVILYGTKCIKIIEDSLSLLPLSFDNTIL